METQPKWGDHRALQCEDGYFRIFTCEPDWPPSRGGDVWLFNGGPAFASALHAERYAATLPRAEPA